jgi:hypothetical protein
MINLDQFTKKELEELQDRIKLKLDERSIRGYHVSFNIVFDTRYKNVTFAQRQVNSDLKGLFNRFSYTFGDDIIRGFHVSILDENQSRVSYFSDRQPLIDLNIPKIGV